MLKQLLFRLNASALFVLYHFSISVCLLYFSFFCLCNYLGMVGCQACTWPTSHLECICFSKYLGVNTSSVIYGLDLRCGIIMTLSVHSHYDLRWKPTYFQCSLNFDSCGFVHQYVNITYRHNKDPQQGTVLGQFQLVHSC